MLETYIKKYHKNNFQYILVDAAGKIIETDNHIIPIGNLTQIQEVHPFFEAFSDLFFIKNESYDFLCINLDFDKTSIIADITLQTHNDNKNLIIIEDLTKHYNNYQLAAQNRNESLINAQILKLKNLHLKEKEQFKNIFIANFSHQLRNPITALNIFSNLLKDTTLDDTQESYVNVINTANKNLKQSVEGILDISKIEAGKLILVEKVFSLKALLNEIINEHKLYITKKNIEFNFILDPKLPEFLNGDSFRLKQIIGNLLSNATYFTLKGFINLNISLNHIRANKANIHIKVSDTGIGIAPKDYEQIFKRFTKIESTIKNDMSTGLGLSITQYLISQMDGNIKVKSEIGIGSVFTCNISFKLATSYDKNLKKILLHKVRKRLDKKHNILLVEDSELIQLSLLKIIAADGNFFLNIISNGDDFISTIIKQDVDLILLSSTIQNYTAEELTKSLRKLSKEYKKIPVISISSKAFKEDIKSLKKAGINDVITKPFEEEILLNTIHKYLK